MMNIHGAKLVSTAFLAGMFQRSPQAIRAALDELRHGPALELNETSYWPYAVIVALRSHFADKERTR